MRLFITLVAVGITCLALNACNTIGGIGQDIQAGGNAITRASN